MTSKLTKIFIETPIWNDDSKKLSKDDSIDNGIQNARMTAKTYGKKPVSVNKYGDFVIEIWEYRLPAVKNKTNVLVFCLNQNKTVGFIRAEKVDGDSLTSKFPVIELTVVKDEYQGKGIGKTMYKNLMDTYSGLISDTSLTGESGTGSYDIWERMGGTYNAYLYFGDKLKRVPKFNRNMLKKNNKNAETRFVVSKEEIK